MVASVYGRGGFKVISVSKGVMLLFLLFLTVGFPVLSEGSGFRET